MRKGCVLPIVVLLVGIIALIVYMKTPAARGVEVDTSSVSEQEGARSLGHGLEVSPRDLEQARGLWESGELTAARAALEGALPGGDAEGVLQVLLSEVCRRLKDDDAALEYGLRGAELLSTSGEAHYVYAKAVMMKAARNPIFAPKYLGAMKTELRNAIELDVTNLEARAMEVFVYVMTPRLMGGDHDLALERAKEMEPFDRPYSLALCATVLEEMDRREDALRAVEDGLATHPNHARLLLTLARLHENDKDWAAADEVYAWAATPPESEQDWHALYKRARLRTSEGQIEGEAAKALELLDQYLAGAPRAEMIPSPADTQHLRGLALEQLDRPDQALAAYEAALEIDPEHRRATKALEALQP